MKYCAVYFPQGMDDDLRLIRERYARAKAAGYRGPGAGPPPYYDETTGDWEYPPVTEGFPFGEPQWPSNPVISLPDWADRKCHQCSGAGEVQYHSGDWPCVIECPICRGAGHL